ncbi:MAG: VOC family protein [Vicinamibacterales bacterium]
MTRQIARATFLETLMADSQNKTLQGTSVMPSLTVNNLQQSLDFFGGLGFEVEDRWEENGVLLGAMLKAGEARLGLSQDDGKKGSDRIKGVGMRIYIEAADDIDQVAARAKTAGITLKTEPHDTEWGSRAFEVTEPSGFALTIASRAST